MTTSDAQVTLRLFAAAREAAGSNLLHVEAGPCNLVLAAAAAGRSERFARVLAVSSLVCDGVRLDQSSTTELAPGCVVDVLPPFAGG